MDEKNNLKYPIKYAVMSIKEQIGLTPGLNELYGRYSIVANIVSKCYVISEKKEYLKDGRIEFSYEVVFPYDIHYDRLKKKLPEYDCDYRCSNSVIVNHIFNNFEEAQALADSKNIDILANNSLFLSGDKFKAQLENHNETIDRYKKMGEIIENETANLEITGSHNSKLDDIIEKIIENPREFYTELANNLAIEEREYLKSLIENKSCMNCSNGVCAVATYEKLGSSACIAWDNKEIIGKQKVLTTQ